MRDARWHDRRCRDCHARGARHARAPAPDSARVHRGAGGAVRLLSQRRNPHRQSVSRSESEGERRGAAAGDRYRPLPLLHARADVEGDQTLRSGEGMMKRRDFLKTSGALVVSFGAASLAERIGLAQGQFGTRASHVDPSQVDSWIAVGADGGVTVYTGKCELGQGMLTAQAQLVAEELAVAVDRVKVIMCDTEVCPDQGTTSGSQSTPTNFNERNL